MTYQLPSIDIDGEIEESLNNVEKVIKDLNDRRNKGLPEALEKKINTHLQTLHVYNSNAIEGNQLSLRETELVLESLSGDIVHGKYETEAISLNKANDYLYDLISGKASLGRKSLLELHGLIMEGSDFERGEYRKGEVTIKNSDHKPPPPALVESSVDELFQWINRSAHEYSPIVMATILHHWLTWIHPFSDGNGRTTRMFFNFFLLQRGYPMIIVKLEDRDAYYDALVTADSGDISKLLELFIDKSRQTVNVYEEFINDLERELEWENKFKQFAKKKEEEYQKARDLYQYDYEIWKRQVEVFRELLKEAVATVDPYLENISFEIQEFEMLTFNKFLDLLEGRRLSGNWYIVLYIYDSENHNSLKLIFYFDKFQITTDVFIFGKPLLDDSGIQQISTANHMKLSVMGRQNRENFELDANLIDLINVGTFKGQLSFGLMNRDGEITPRTKKTKTPPRIITKHDNPNLIVRNFMDQVLKNYFSIDV